jgi:hypothetical protein
VPPSCWPAARLGEAVALLKDGIGKIPADKNLFALYQFAAELLARDGKAEEAVYLLKEGIGKISSQQGGYKLAESLILLATKAGRRDWLNEFMAQGRAVDSNASQAFLAEAWLKASEGDWEGMAQTVARGRESYPGYFALYAQEAYAWLAAANPPKPATLCTVSPKSSTTRQAAAPLGWPASSPYTMTTRNQPLACMRLIGTRKPPPRPSKTCWVPGIARFPSLLPIRLISFPFCRPRSAAWSRP